VRRIKLCKLQNYSQPTEFKSFNCNQHAATKWERSNLSTLTNYNQPLTNQDQGPFQSSSIDFAIIENKWLCPWITHVTRRSNLRIIVFNLDIVRIHTISIQKINLFLNFLSSLIYTQNLCLQIFDTLGRTSLPVISSSKKTSSTRLWRSIAPTNTIPQPLKKETNGCVSKEFIKVIIASSNQGTEVMTRSMTTAADSFTLK